MRNTRPIICVSWQNGDTDRARYFESFDAAERFMDYCENQGWIIITVELV